jgi:two-component system, sensor histidine kinase
MPTLPRLSLTTSLALLLILMVLASQLGAYRVASELLASTVQERELAKAKTIGRVAESFLADVSENLRLTATLLRDNAALLHAFALRDAGDVEAVAQALTELNRSLHLEILEATDDREIVIHRAHDPLHKGDRAKSWGVAEALQGKGSVVSSADSSGVHLLAIEPLRLGGKVVGTITAGATLDHKFITDLSREAGAALALVTREGVLAASNSNLQNALDRNSVSEAFLQKQPIYAQNAASRQIFVYLPVLIVDEAYVILVAIDSTEAYRFLDRSVALSAKWGSIILLGSMLLGMTMLRVLLRPLRNLRKDAESAAVEFTGSAIEAGRGDEIASVVEVLETLTSRMAARNRELAAAKVEAEVASAAKSTFMSSMSHEIRTPLSAVLGMAELLEGTPLNDEQRRFLRGISVSGRMLHDLLSNVLDLSKMEAGKIELVMANFEPAMVVQDIVEAFGATSSSRATIILTEIDPDVSAVVGDSTRLRQVLFNLVGNAMKFTTQGSITLAARRLEPRPNDSRIWLEFGVRDSGIGIAPEALERLFQPFSQADATIAHTYGGTGLGLAICKGLVELMGGTIAIQSTQGAGTTIRFELPFTQKAGADPLELTSPQPSLTTAARVLVAEDNAINQEIIGALLQRLGANATIVGNGALALAALRTGRFDVVLMDCNMPVMDGYEATRRIRAEPVRNSIPIIALTANALAEDRQRCMDAGMDDFLSKPIPMSSLAKALARWAPAAASQGAGPVQPKAVQPPTTQPKGAQPDGARPQDALADGLSPQELQSVPGPLQQIEARARQPQSVPAEELQPVNAVALDAEALDNIRVLQKPGSPNLLEKLIARYYEDTPRLIAQIQEALRQGDAPAVERATHQLKSSRANLGASRFADDCKNLEMLARSKSLQGAEPLLAALQIEYRRVCEALAATRLTRSPPA